MNAMQWDADSLGCKATNQSHNSSLVLCWSSTVYYCLSFYSPVPAPMNITDIGKACAIFIERFIWPIRVYLYTAHLTEAWHSFPCLMLYLYILNSTMYSDTHAMLVHAWLGVIAGVSQFLGWQCGLVIYPHGYPITELAQDHINVVETGQYSLSPPNGSHPSVVNFNTTSSFLHYTSRNRIFTSIATILISMPNFSENGWEMAE